MIEPGIYDHKIQRRADYSSELEFLDSTNTPIDFTGWSGVAEIWDAARQVKYADFAITFTNRVGGKLKLTLPSNTTVLLPNSALWDLMLIEPSGFRSYWLEGSVIVSEGYSEP